MDVRYTQTNNTLVANFTIAVNRSYVKEGEERQADFIPIVVWGKTAEFSQKYLKKGMQVGITGRIQTRNWDDDQGQKHYATEVIAEHVYFADSKREDTQSNVQSVPINNSTTIQELESSELPF